MVTKITFEENLADPFTKFLPERVFEKHVNCMGRRSVPNFRANEKSLHLCSMSKTISNFILCFNDMNYLNSYTCVVSHIRSRLIMQYMII